MSKPTFQTERVSPETTSSHASMRAKRMSPEERKTEIVRGAIAYFAEGGFGSQTRELTQRLGISNALLFKYFPTKDALVEAIYEELFLKRWNPQWETGLSDRTRPLPERLEHFYLEYSKMLHDREWVRIYLYSGLSGAPLAKRFGQMVRERIYVRVINELRQAFSFASTTDSPCTEDEIELMWSLHGSIAYIGIRKWVYGSSIPSDVDSVVCRLVREFLSAAEAFLLEGKVPRAAATDQPPAEL